MTTLETIWLILITGIWSLYLALGGAELGATMLLRIGGERERAGVLRTIGPTWQANDVWLIIAIAAMFGAFPVWYADWSQALYLPLVIVIVALIARHGGIELAGHMGPRGQRLWARAVIFSSVVIPLGWGVIWAAAADGSLAEGGFGALSPQTLLTGVALVGLCYITGVALVAHRSDGRLAWMCQKRLRRLGPLCALLAVLAVAGVSITAADEVTAGPLTYLLLAVAAVALLAVGTGGLRGNARAVEVGGGVAIGALLGALMAALAPFAFAGPEAVNLGETAAGNYTLAWMAGLTAVVVPLLLIALTVASRLPSGPRKRRRSIFEGLR